MRWKDYKDLVRRMWCDEDKKMEDIADVLTELSGEPINRNMVAGALNRFNLTKKALRAQGVEVKDNRGGFRSTQESNTDEASKPRRKYTRRIKTQKEQVPQCQDFGDDFDRMFAFAGGCWGQEYTEDSPATEITVEVVEVQPADEVIVIEQIVSQEVVEEPVDVPLESEPNHHVVFMEEPPTVDVISEPETMVEVAKTVENPQASNDDAGLPMYDRFPRSGKCLFPIGDPRDTDFHFCGENTVREKPYCECHMKIAYDPPSDHKRAAGGRF